MIPVGESASDGFSVGVLVAADSSRLNLPPETSPPREHAPVIATGSGGKRVRDQLGEAGIRVLQTPFRAPNANTYAERFVRTIKCECLNRMIPPN